jgi:DNA processing protein
MKYTDNAINMFTVKSYKGIGKAWMVKNMKGIASIDDIVFLLNTKSKQESEISVADFIEKRSRLEERLQSLEGFCDGIIAIGDDNFPKYRGNVIDSEQPVFLYYKGDIDLLSINNNNISVIGLLNPERDIEERTREITNRFVENGATILSGLAMGCDSISHRQALDSKGRTVAILPSPLSKILPSSNNGLAHEIVEKGGLLVSEYGNDVKSRMELNSRYQERDRLQALFANAVVLAASYAPDSSKLWAQLSGQKLDSGARLAMNYAKKYNIRRAVMYHDSDKGNPMFDLNRQLIKEQATITVINRDNLTNAVQKLIFNSMYHQTTFNFNFEGE